MAPTFLGSILAVGSAYVAPPNNNSSTGQAGGATSLNTTGATLLVAVLCLNDGNAAVPNITDSENNVWNFGPFGKTASGAPCIGLAWVINPVTSPTHTFNIPAPVQEGTAWVFAFQTPSTYANVDAEVTSAETGGTSVTTTDVTVLAGDIVVAGIGSNGSEVSGTVNNGFSGGISGDPSDTALPQKLSGSPEVGLGAYIIVGAGGTLNATFTASLSNVDWLWTIGVFRGPVVPPGASGGKPKVKLPFLIISERNEKKLLELLAEEEQEVGQA